MSKFYGFSNSYPVSILLAITTTMAHSASAQPSERVYLGNYALDKTEVTIAQFRTFARATQLVTTAEREGGGFEYVGGWSRRAGWTYEKPQGKAGVDNDPAVHLSWHEAKAYCTYVGGRLPNSSEWLSAAYFEQREQPPAGFVKGKTYLYPVGDKPDGMNNNRSNHVPVATTKRGVNGLYDMGANVWEWLADSQGEQTATQALTAGGSWWYGAEQTRSDGVQWKAANFYAVYIGLRCAYDLKPNSTSK